MLKQHKLLILSALCAALATTQTPCAQEATPTFAPDLIDQQDPDGQEPSAQADNAAKHEIFDVEKFVEQVERGELTDEEIRADMNRISPPRFQRDHSNRHTPAGTAIECGKIVVLNILIDLGADLDKAGEWGLGKGYTPLMTAVRSGGEALTILIGAKANVNAQGQGGKTPLIESAYHGCPESLQTLIDAKALPDILEDHGQTALIKAITSFKRSPAAVRILLHANANPNIVDRHGKNAWAYAIQNRNEHPKEMREIMELLVAAGA